MTEFRSAFAKDLQEFLDFKRALGHAYRRSEFMLRSFDRFAAEHSPACDLDALVRQWLARRGSRAAVTAALEFGVVRQFFLHRRRHDPDAFVPDRAVAPWGRGSLFTPCVPTVEQIRQILAEVSRIDAPPPIEPGFRVVFLVLYCAGLRFGEVARLRLRDVDLDRHVLHVLDSKGKSRSLPFRADLASELQQYRDERTSASSQKPFFFRRRDGRAYTTRRISDVLCAVLRRLGLKPAVGRVGPRPYDIRHAFAVHRLALWHQDGLDVHARLPLLSAYMGHDDLLGTETYLTATPELLEESSRRLRARLDTSGPR